MRAAEIIEADLTWTGEEFEAGVQVEIGRDGRIARVGSGLAGRGRAGRRLRGKALLPGFVNVHSHAFQRGLRGEGETFARARAGSFWTWRQSMYVLVERMDETTMHALSLQAFSEMRAAGITAVGEFHYLRHDDPAGGYGFDEVVLHAAAEAGIRIALLCAYYKTGGVCEPLAAAQTRFATPAIDEFWARFDRLAGAIDPATQSLGIAPHSIRAVPPEDLAMLAEEARRRGLVVHMHVEEQPAEIEACLKAYGRTPMAIVNDIGPGPRFTAVHCTHTSDEDMRRFVAGGGRVCACPLTEGNLGDGIPLARRNVAALCLGTDSNSRLCYFEEMRWLEYAQRLATGTRGVIVDERGRCAAALLRAATVNGAVSLGIDAGRIAPGMHADMVAIDLDAPELRGWTRETLAETIVFGAGNACIAGTCVGGRWGKTAKGGLP
jgi:formimidoylglutamate deiminase